MFVMFYELHARDLFKQQNCVISLQILVDKTNIVAKMKIRCRTKGLHQKIQKGANEMTGGTIFLVVTGAICMGMQFLKLVDLAEGVQR